MANGSDFAVENRPLTRGHATEKKIPLGGIRKRILDIVLSVLLLITLSPIFVVVALAIKLCDGGPVFFVHRRVGFLSRPFNCLKFRTMAIDTVERLKSFLAENKHHSREWSANRKLKSDPRLIPIGLILRRMSVDELPQLINVLRGDMSLVGPRPIVSDELAHYGPDAALYLSVRPGLTGAWQVSGRSDTTYKTRVGIDREYCLNWSTLRDITIIVRTVPAVLLARGSY
jgi:exopolysaccharide production protein ExoY